MKRELKALLNDHNRIQSEWLKMTIYNSTEEERKNKRDELSECREKIGSLCMSILGVRTLDQAEALANSMNRGIICSRFRNYSPH